MLFIGKSKKKKEVESLETERKNQELKVAEDKRVSEDLDAKKKAEEAKRKERINKILEDAKKKPIVKKEPAKSEEVEKKVPTRKNYHVSLRTSDGKWQVKFASGQKAIKLFDTQAQAIEFAKALAESQEGLITIHKVDGKIRKQDYSKK